VHGANQERIDIKIIFVRLVCAVLLCTSGFAYGDEFTAKVIEVLDGDTVLIVRPGGLLKVRLAEIDAPEKSQAFGADSTRSLSGMVMGKQVKFVSQTMDQYGRMVAHLSIKGLDVNAEQIRRGMAWEYSNYHSNKALIALQNEAKQALRGLWVQDDPTAPWEWRKLHPFTMHNTVAAPVADQAAMHNADCGNKSSCSEMSSCEEAKYYFEQCGMKFLDSDDDGTPCEELCVPQKQIKN
jgi:micrococcal nuclease